MSEATASTNVETGGAYSDSGTGSSAEAGTSGPASANDNVASPEPANDDSQFGGGAASDGPPEPGQNGPAVAIEQSGTVSAVNDNQLQSDTTSEASAELSGTPSAVAGEGVPAGAAGTEGVQRIGDPPQQQPGDTPQEAPGDAPRQQPGDLPQEQIGDPLQHQPGDLPQQQPGDLLQQDPGDVPEQQPGDTPQQQPGDTPQQQPGDTPQQQIGDPPQEPPGDAPQQRPGDAPHQQPTMAADSTNGSGQPRWGPEPIKDPFNRVAGKGDPPAPPPSSPPGGARGEPLVPTPPAPARRVACNTSRVACNTSQAVRTTFSGRGIAATGTEENDSNI
jgi:hypothetical protein